jgi:hypothetical protein
LDLIFQLALPALA